MCVRWSISRQGRQHGAESWDRAGPFGPAGGRCHRAVERSTRPGAACAAPRGRSAGAGRGFRPRHAPAELAAGSLEPNGNRRDGLEMAPGASRDVACRVGLRQSSGRRAGQAAAVDVIVERNGSGAAGLRRGSDASPTPPKVNGLRTAEAGGCPAFCFWGWWCVGSGARQGVVRHKPH